MIQTSREIARHLRQQGCKPLKGGFVFGDPGRSVGQVGDTFFRLIEGHEVEEVKLLVAKRRYKDKSNTRRQRERNRMRDPVRVKGGKFVEWVPK